MDKLKIIKLSALGIIPVSVLMSCNPAEPAKLTSEHSAYNQSIMDAQNKEILRNVVREYYNEAPSYLSISSIYTSRDSPSYSGTVEQDGFYGSSEDLLSLSTLSLSPSLGSTSASVTYTPNTGSDYAQQLLNPIDISYIASIGFSESNLRDVLRLAVGRIGPWDNAYPFPSKTNTSVLLKSTKKYLEFVDMLQGVFSENGHTLHLVPLAEMSAKTDTASKKTSESNDYVIVIPVKKGHSYTENERELLKEIGVDAEADKILLSTKEAPGITLMVPRTMIGIGKSLSLLIGDVPYKLDGSVATVVDDKDKVSKLLPSPEDSSLYDRSELRKMAKENFFTIYSSDEKPRDTYIAVTEHDRWFYIKNSDSQSKETFETLELLYDVTRIVPRSNTSYYVS